jgi:lipoate-protein ligase A
MKLYNLGLVPWLDSQLIYHALPRLGGEGLILLSPDSPYVCIGYHQDLAQEVDVAYCEIHSIPLFRREVGGGAVYLDSGQLFYQLIIRSDSPLVPSGKEAFYRKFLEPVAETYRAIGIPAKYRPVNDVITEDGRKISGTGAAEIEGHLVLVGNLIIDFNYEMMARILKVPDEKYRDKVYKTMEENLTTIERELGMVPPRSELERLLVTNFKKVLGPLEEDTLDEQVRQMVTTLAKEFQTEEWLNKKGKRREGWETKIATGVEVRQKVHKAPGGLIRATTVVREGVIDSISISGDFFFYPKEELEALEAALEGKPLSQAEKVIGDFYRKKRIESPGVTPSDLAKVLL